MKIREVTEIALMTAVIIVLGLIPPIPLGFIPVPIVLQNLG
ncbi:substrate-specific component BioY of biotin ECF transporter [Lentilactobacillus farraginis DSM 18382 = JCM 14108]|nr:substrate-specific component BioY of biotin ECF transporter [Lentilactobacillus farraginis DSM 18382 = JCM 14108]